MHLTEEKIQEIRDWVGEEFPEYISECGGSRSEARECMVTDVVLGCRVDEADRQEAESIVEEEIRSRDQ